METILLPVLLLLILRKISMRNEDEKKKKNSASYKNDSINSPNFIKECGLLLFTASFLIKSDLALVARMKKMMIKNRN